MWLANRPSPDRRLFDPLYGSRRRIAAASGGRRQRSPPLYLHPAVVGRHHGHHTRPVGTAGEAGGAGAAPADARGALRRVFGATQSAAQVHHPAPTPARRGRAGGRQRLATLGLGTTAEAGVCLRPGALPSVWAGDAAPQRRHHPHRGSPHDAAPSQARPRPAADCPGAGLPRPLRMGLALSTQRLFPRPLGAGCGRGAPALHQAGRGWRARVCVRRLSGQAEGFVGPDRWFVPPRAVAHGACPGCGRWVDATQICFKRPIRFPEMGCETPPAPSPMSKECCLKIVHPELLR
jgi:hypothetical protein